MVRMKVEFSPYTFARVSVMKSKLLKKIDYDRMLKMKMSEITKFLEDTEYKEEINQYALFHEGADLIETALFKNLGKTLKKLYFISNDSMKILLAKYLNRKDIWNLKTIIRGKYAGLESSEISKMIVPVGSIREEKLDALIEMESINDILRNIPIIDYRFFKKAINHFEETKSLSLIENTIDQHYFNDLVEFLEIVPASADKFKDFLLVEIDILNIKNLIKLKRAGSDNKFIGQHMFYSGKKLNKVKIAQLIKAKDINDLIGLLADGPYKSIIEPHYKEDIDLISLEIGLDNYLLQKARFMPHVSPLSVNGILGYMFAKEIEINNIHMIVRSKQLGIGEKFVKDHLVAG